MTVEATRGNNWVIDYFDKHRIPLIVAKPFLNRAIANVHCKNDKYDSAILADLTRYNMVATCYVPSKPIRELRDLICHRSKLVQMSTQFKNKIHLLMAKYNYQQPVADLFGAAGRTWMKRQKISPLHQVMLQENLQLLDTLAPRILALEKTIKNKVHEHPYNCLL